MTGRGENSIIKRAPLTSLSVLQRLLVVTAHGSCQPEIPGCCSVTSSTGRSPQHRSVRARGPASELAGPWLLPSASEDPQLQ